MNDDQVIERLYPTIPWRQPLLVTRASARVVADDERIGELPEGARLCCRLCVAHRGLRAVDLERVGFATREDYDRHMAAVHP